MEGKQIIVRCDDHCGMITFDKFYDEDVYFISYFAPVFYTDQESVLYKIKDRIKMIWYILSGKKYRLYEIILTKEKMKEFASKVNEMVE